MRGVQNKMTWQDIYGEMQDDCGKTIQHTSSRRGIVKNIAFHVETNSVGNPVDVCVVAADRNKTFNTGEIKRKIQEWKNKENHTRSKEGMIKYWENKLKMAETHNAEVKQKNKVQILLNFPSVYKDGLADKEILVYFEGTELTISDIKNIRNNALLFKQFLYELKGGNNK